MTRTYRRVAWTAAIVTYLLIVLGAVVRITGSGLGCGNHWPLCNGRLLPPLDLPTIIEYGHRLVAATVSVLVIGLAALTWWIRRESGEGKRETWAPGQGAYAALGLLIVQVALGAITVKLDLPPWTIILHLGTAMLLLATLLVVARGTPMALSRLGGVGMALAFATVLLGGLTANLGAASACLGFPLCNGQVVPDGNYFQYVHWTHRLLAFSLVGVTGWWAYAARSRGPRIVLGLVLIQVAIGAAMVLWALPPVLRAAHVAAGAAVWGAMVLSAL